MKERQAKVLDVINMKKKTKIKSKKESKMK